MGTGLTVLLVAVLAIAAAGGGLGREGPAEGEVAVVEGAAGGEDVRITRAELDAALEAAAGRQGLDALPPEGDPEHELIRETALGDLLLAVWLRGEAAERGVAVTPEQVQAELDQLKQEQFEGRERRFQRFLTEAGIDAEQAFRRVELQMLADGIQAAILPPAPTVGEDEIEAYYEDHPEQFADPETGVAIPLVEAREQIRQAIAGRIQQQAAQDFQAAFNKRWRAHTICAEGFEIDRCANAAPAVAACSEEVAAESGCPAPVPSTQPIEPGSADPFSEPAGRPQGPLTPEALRPADPDGVREEASLRRPADPVL